MTQSQSARPRQIRRSSVAPLGAAAVVLAAAALTACEKKPSEPPRPTASSEGPTAAGGGAPSANYPVGLTPAPANAAVAGASPHQGPSEGGAAVGGMAPGQAGGTPTQGNAMPMSAGDRASESKPR